MSKLDNSFELLSSMSPKLNKFRKRHKLAKPPCKLSLKKYFGKSAIFDKQPHVDLDDSVIIIEDSFEDNNFSKIKVKINKSANLLSLSSESVSDSCEEIDKENSNKLKFSNVDNWLTENEKVEEHSEVHSFKHRTYLDGDNDSLFSDNSTSKLSVNIDKGIKTDAKIELVNNVIKENINNISTKINSDIFTPIKNKDKHFPSRESLIDNSFEENLESYESILDTLYGTSWREKKSEILPQSERKPARKHIQIQAPKTERKPSYKKLPETKRKAQNALLTSLKNLCDSDSDITSSSFNSSTNRKLDFGDSEDEMAVIKPAAKTYVKRPIKTTRASPGLSPSSNSDSDSDCDLNVSLRTRVQNKLMGSIILKQLSSTPKKTLVVKENVKKKIKKKLPESEINKNVEIEIKSKSKTQVPESPRCNEQSDMKGTMFSFLYSLSDCLPAGQSDKEARYYRDNYAKEKEALAQCLFDLYNATIFDSAIPKDTPIEWNPRVNKTAGLCYNRRLTRRDGRVERMCRIVLAPKVLTCAARLRDTLVHEMCHAATWIVDGLVDGHGPIWRAWASKAHAAHPELPPIRVCHNYVIQTKYTYKCRGCGYTIGRHSKSLDVERKRCGLCLGQFEVFINKKGKGGDVRAEPAASKKPRNAPFADYVKEHYKNVRKPDVNHGEAMKILGQRFKLMKLNK